MAWIECKKRRDGSISYWIRDRRDGRQVSIPAPDGVDRAFVERMMATYLRRRELEKHGYDDQYAGALPPAERAGN